MSTCIQHLFEKIINLKTINQNLLQINYAIGGEIEVRANQITEDLKNGRGHYPFRSITETHKANPKLYGFPSFSFYRQVLSILLNPSEINNPIISKDIKKRVHYYFGQIDHNIGSLSPASGYGFIRNNVAKFVNNQSGMKIKKDDVILTEGSCNAINLIFNSIISNSNDGIMVPSPNFPLITSLVSLNNGKLVYYCLDEENEWQFNLEDIEEQYNHSLEEKINVKAIFLINPGNPTSKVIRLDKLQKLIEFCWEKRILILCDEVYQENVYNGTKFISLMKALKSMPEPYNLLEIFCFNSTSKGLISEGGVRGGYVAMANIDSEVKKYIERLRSIHMCSNTVGQIMIDLMVNPPSSEECDEDTMENFANERENFLKTFAKRAEIANDYFKKMKNLTCQTIEATYYAFPRLKINEKISKLATEKKMAPDMLYSMEGCLFFINFFLIFFNLKNSIGKNWNNDRSRKWIFPKKWNSSFQNDSFDPS